MNSYRLIVRYFGMLCLLLFSTLVNAHEVRPAIADIQFLSDGQVKISIEANLEALIAGIGPKHKNTNDSPNAAKYDELRGLAPEALQIEYQVFSEKFSSGVQLLFDGKPIKLLSQAVEIADVGDIRLSRKSSLHLLGAAPPQAKSVVFQYAPQFGNVAAKFRHNDEAAQSVHWLVGGKPSPAFKLDSEVVPQSWLQLAWNYMQLGYVHIVPRGLDHILFVLGLFLLSMQLRPLLTQVTVFTLAHSITLGLSIYGFISLSPLIVEPLIALSIAYVGLENIFRAKNSISRLVVIFAFGLLHGMGFAGVLADIGLPKSDFLTALITFNIGVEFGQLSVILAAFLIIMLLRLKGHARYRQWVVIPGSAMITVMGLFWFFQRVGII